MMLVDDPRDPWNPDQYDRFQKERRQPLYDLLALIQRQPGMRVLDLGCGTGEVTRIVHRHVESVETIGIDSSEVMLSRARQIVESGLRFEHGDIETFVPDRQYDLVFSHAALNWVHGHADVLRRLTGAVAPGGQIAFQLPANHDHPTHLVATAVAQLKPFRGELRQVRSSMVLEPEQYAVLLHKLGYAEQHVRLQVYSHLLASREEAVEWVKGTLLLHYQRQMSPELFEQFLAAYREHLMARLEDSRPFFYTFKRILLWARQLG